MARVMCECGHYGTQEEGKEFVCRACTARGRKGAPWPGDYYSEPGLEDRAGHFMGGQIKVKGKALVEKGKNRGWGFVPVRTAPSRPKEILSTSEMYGNLVVQVREDLALLCDLYNFKTAVLPVSPEFLVNTFLAESPATHLYLLGGKGERDEDRVTFINSDSILAVDEVPDPLQFVYVPLGESVTEFTQNLAAWWWKVKQGGLLAGHGYSRPEIKESLLKFCTSRGLDVHLIREPPSASEQGNREKKDGEGQEVGWFLWKKG